MELREDMTITDHMIEKMVLFFHFIYAYCEYCVDHNMV